MNKKQLIFAWVIMSTFIIFSETLAYDFQYEYAPFAKEQIYTRKAQDENGILREYNIIGVFTCRYTTERDNEWLEKEDVDKFVKVLNELNIDITDNYHVIQSEPINPISLQSQGLILPAIAKYYRRTAVCNALRLKINDSRAEKSKPKWKQKLIDWIEGI